MRKTKVRRVHGETKVESWTFLAEGGLGIGRLGVQVCVADTLVFRCLDGSAATVLDFVLFGLVVSGSKKSLGRRRWDGKWKRPVLMLGCKKAQNAVARSDKLQGVPSFGFSVDVRGACRCCRVLVACDKQETGVTSVQGCGLPSREASTASLQLLTSRSGQQRRSARLQVGRVPESPPRPGSGPVPVCAGGQGNRVAASSSVGNTGLRNPVRSNTAMLRNAG